MWIGFVWNQVYVAWRKTWVKKHPSSKIAQVQSHTNPSEDTSIHHTSLASPWHFACCQAGFWLSSNSLAGSQGSLWAFWGNLPLHFPAAFTYCPSGAQGEPIPLPSSPQAAPAQAPAACTTRAPPSAVTHWPLLLTSSCIGMNFPSKRLQQIHLETSTICKKKLACYLLSVPSPCPVICWPLRLKC